MRKNELNASLVIVFFLFVLLAVAVKSCMDRDKQIRKLQQENLTYFQQTVQLKHTLKNKRRY